MLNGTLDTVSLAEILGLLEQTRKTGALHVRGTRHSGTLYVAAGRFCGAEAGELTGAVGSPDELDARLVDVCFALCRLDEGTFEFEPDRLPPWPVRGGADVTPIVARVQRLLRDWLEIEVVIPSLDAVPHLTRELGGDAVSFDRATWPVLVAIDGHRSVRDLARHLGRSVLEVCHAVKELVDAGAASVTPSEASAVAAPPAPDAATSETPIPSEADEDVKARFVAAAAAASAAEDGRTSAPPDVPPVPPAARPEDEGEEGEREEGPREVRDRGALLRLFSSLRD